jgi:hypothetical protein
MNMGSSTSHRRGAGETTEWEDILRKKGITEPSEAERALLAAAEEQAVRMAEEAATRIDPLAGKSVAELDELEEEGGEFADSRALEGYRARRIAELKAKAAANRFGALLPLTRVDFVREVSEASADCWVVVFLHQDHVADSQLLARVLPRVAAAHAAAKFMAIKADACIEGYPDRNVPTLLLYHKGALQSQVVGLAELGGARLLSERTVEWVLAKRGAVATELEDDPREAASASSSGRGYAARAAARRDEDSDEDDGGRGRGRRGGGGRYGGDD